MKTRLFFFLILLSAGPTLWAQLKHTQHQTFPMDSINQVRIELVDSFAVETWAGNQLMTETQVQLYQASESVLKFFLKNERYTIVNDSTVGSNATLLLRSKDTVRKGIKTKFGECEEKVHVRIFVPRDFEKKQFDLWARPPKKEE
jgi:hypothetical protein